MNNVNVVSDKELIESKNKLKEIIDYINSPSYYSISEKSKNLVNNMRTGLEIYVNSMSSLLYDDKEDTTTVTSNLFIPLLFSMFMYNGFGSNSYSTDRLKEQLDKNDKIYEIK